MDRVTKGATKQAGREEERGKERQIKALWKPTASSVGFLVMAAVVRDVVVLEKSYLKGFGFGEVKKERSSRQK